MRHFSEKHFSCHLSWQMMCFLSYFTSILGFSAKMDELSCSKLALFVSGNWRRRLAGFFIRPRFTGVGVESPLVWERNLSKEYGLRHVVQAEGSCLGRPNAEGGGVKSTLVWVRNTAHPTGRRVWVDRWKGRVECICEEMKGVEYYSPGVHQGWLNSGPA